MAQYVKIDSVLFENFLYGKGFHRFIQGNEVVYIKEHELTPAIKIKVYTSIRIGADSARSCGKDAIRVIAIFDDGRKNFGIAKLPRVYRTTSQDAVQKRTLERMREAYRLANEWRKRNRWSL